MLSSDRRSFVLRRIFDAKARGRVHVPVGLSQDQRVALALQSDIFTAGERAWLAGESRSSGGRLFGGHQLGDPRLRVGFVQSGLHRVGGIESWLRTFTGHLRSAKIVGVCASVPHGDIFTDGLGVPVGVGIDEAAELAENVDVLVASNEFRLEAILAKASARPRVVMVHHGDQKCEASKRAIIGQRPLIDHVVAVNPAVAESLALQMPKVTHIRNSPDPRRTEPRVPRARLLADVGIPAFGRVVLYSGRFAREKGYELAREIGTRLPEGYWLVTMGGMDHFQHPRIRCVGKQQHPGNWYHAADVAISTSHSEGAGLGMMEIVLSGLPLLASPCGVVLESPELAKIVSAEATADDWVRAILHDVEDDRGQEARRARAREIIHARYSVDEFVRRWSALLSEVAR
jgi:glycosyltransferase involved in cell wall biosynthesis